MKKNENVKLLDERKGFWKIGFLEKQDYYQRIADLTHREIPQEEVDETIEKKRVENSFQYYNAQFAVCGEKDALFCSLSTSFKAFRTGNEILAGFYRATLDGEWKGVFLEQTSESLQYELTNERVRSDIKDYTYIYSYQSIARACNKYYQSKYSDEYWANHIGKLFTKCKNENLLYSFDSGSFFPAQISDADGEQMYFWMVKNEKPGARQTGFGINLVSTEDLLEYWSENRYEKSLDRMVFVDWDDLEDFVSDVAEKAMPENWGRINTPTPELSYGNPVLKSYLEYTLVRLRILDKTSSGYLLREDGNVYFNTGLLNKFFRQILIAAQLIVENYELPGLGNVKFEFYHNPHVIVTGHDTKFPSDSGNLLEMPKIANYFEKKEDVLYDASLEIMLNDEHIFEDGLKAGRIPMFREEYQQSKNNPEAVKNLHVRVQARVQTAIQRARLLAERNHKLAVPQFWKEDAEVQFLLPLYMEEAEYTGKPQCALALRRSKSGNYYEGATILSLDMAYNNARLIARPDITWLNRKDGLSDPSCKAAYEPVIKELERKILNSSNAFDDDTNEGELPPDERNIGEIATLTSIISRPGGKGLKGIVFESSGTVARNLLKSAVPNYTGGELEVKIVDINPQRNQYICEPIE